MMSSEVELIDELLLDEELLEDELLEEELLEELGPHIEDARQVEGLKWTAC